MCLLGQLRAKHQRLRLYLPIVYDLLHVALLQFLLLSLVALRRSLRLGFGGDSTPLLPLKREILPPIEDLRTQPLLLLEIQAVDPDLHGLGTMWHFESSDAIVVLQRHAFSWCHY